MPEPSAIGKNPLEYAGRETGPVPRPAAWETVSMRLVKACCVWQWLVTAITIGLSFVGSRHDTGRASVGAILCLVLDTPLAAAAVIALLVFVLRRWPGPDRRRNEVINPALMGLALSCLPVLISAALLFLDPSSFR